MSIFFDPTQPKLQSGQVFIRSPQNPREFLYIEIQGDITSTLPATGGLGDDDMKRHLWGQRLGDYFEKEGGECTLQVGNLLLVGVKEKLKKPLLVLQKAPLSYEEQRVLQREKAEAAQESVLYEVHDVDALNNNPHNTLKVTMDGPNTGGEEMGDGVKQEVKAEVGDMGDDHDTAVGATFDPYGQMRHQTYMDQFQDTQPQTQDPTTTASSTAQNAVGGLLAQQQDEKKINDEIIPPKRHMLCRGVILYKIKFDKRPIPLVRALGNK